jgi:hypothetical protein
VEVTPQTRIGTENPGTGGESGHRGDSMIESLDMRPDVIDRGAAIVSLAVLAAVIPPASATAEEGLPEHAMEMFDRGVELFKEHDYAGALAEFQAAYAIKPHFSVLFNIAQCHVMVENYADALEHYRQYLLQGADYLDEERIAYVEKEIERLEGLLSPLTLTISPDGAAVEIDGKLVGESPIEEERYLDPGKHSITIEKPGYERIDEEFIVRREEALALEFELAPLAQEQPPAPIEDERPVEDPEPEETPPAEAAGGRDKLHVGGFAGTLAAGVAAGGAALVCGLLAGRTHDDYLSLRREILAGTPSDGDMKRHDDLRDRGRALNAAFVVSLVVSSAAMVAAAILAPFTRFEKRRVQARVGPGSLSLRLVF